MAEGTNTEAGVGQPPEIKPSPKKSSTPNQNAVESVSPTEATTPNEVKVLEIPPVVDQGKKRTVYDENTIERKEFFEDQAKSAGFDSEILNSMTRDTKMMLANVYSGPITLPDKFKSFSYVLKNSEEIRGSEELQVVSISLLVDGVSKNSIIEVLKKGMEASPEAIDEVFEKSIKEPSLHGFLFDPHFVFISKYLEVGKVLLEISSKLENAGATRFEVQDLIAKSKNFKDFERWGSLNIEELTSIFKYTPDVAVELREQFTKDTTDFFFRAGYAGSYIGLGNFLYNYPQYTQLTLKDISHLLPKHLELIGSNPNDASIRLSPNTFNKYAYRAEQWRPSERSETVDSIFQSRDINLFFGRDPDRPIRILSEGSTQESLLWIFNEEFVAESFKKGITNENLDFDINYPEFIPFKFVKHIVVSNDIKEFILTRYGADNTEFFGRPLKDVVIGIEGTSRNDFREAVLKKIIELNSTVPEDK